LLFEEELDDFIEFSEKLAQLGIEMVFDTIVGSKQSKNYILS